MKKEWRFLRNSAMNMCRKNGNKSTVPCTAQRRDNNKEWRSEHECSNHQPGRIITDLYRRAGAVPESSGRFRNHDRAGRCQPEPLPGVHRRKRRDAGGDSRSKSGYPGIGFTGARTWVSAEQLAARTEQREPEVI